MDPLQLTTAQQFEQERIGRLLDAVNDPADLRAMAKPFLQSWFVQKAATAWVMRQQLPERKGAPAAAGAPEVQA